MASGKTIANFSLLFISFLLGIFLCELFLRIFYPKYQHVTESHYDYNTMRIWSTIENRRSTARHPDSGLYHSYYHNNLGMRQHRDFSRVDLESAINIGFFGDSFTENVRIESQYSFNEPLDYLLNLSQKQSNTLNLGVDGYGTGQSFLHYKSFRYAEKLDYVFYLFTDNDLRNIYETNLFYLDEGGELARNEAIQPSWWIRFPSRLHIVYLLLDVGQRLPFVAGKIFSNLEERSLEKRLRMEHSERYHSPRADSIERDFEEGRVKSGDVEDSVIIFQQLIHLWKRLVEENGGKFYIVILPRLDEVRVTTILDDEFDVINLYDCFNEYVKDYQQREWRYQAQRFKRDGHWNEAGNQLATVCLYRFLEQEVGLPVLSDTALREAFFTYYSSFEGWMPDERWIKQVPVPPHVQEGIRDKYLALEKPESEAD